MFKIEQCSREYGDCTADYKVTLNRECTVKEFIEYVLTNCQDEWGYIGIGFHSFGNPRCEYSHGKLESDPLPDKILSKKIIKVNASGGWSRMDYNLGLEGDIILYG